MGPEYDANSDCICIRASVGYRLAPLRTQPWLTTPLPSATPIRDGFGRNGLLGFACVDAV